MNERIKELIEQSGLTIPKDSEYNGHVYTHALERLTAAIVKETIKEFSYQLYWYGIDHANNPAFYKAIENTEKNLT